VKLRFRACWTTQALMGSACNLQGGRADCRAR
jgi:hypothetical protein